MPTQTKSGDQNHAENIDTSLNNHIAKKADHCQTKSCQPMREKIYTKTKARISKPKAQTNL